MTMQLKEVDIKETCELHIRTKLQAKTPHQQNNTIETFQGIISKQKISDFQEDLQGFFLYWQLAN
jgi:hypothetical protein